MCIAVIGASKFGLKVTRARRRAGRRLVTEADLRPRAPDSEQALEMRAALLHLPKVTDL